MANTSENVEAKLVGRGVFSNGNELRVFEEMTEYIYCVINSFGTILDMGHTEIRDRDVYSPLDYVLYWCEPAEVCGSYTI